jgi:hypothetical protein
MEAAEQHRRLVERGSAAPAGMSERDSADQAAIHEQLAASVRDPAAALEGSSEQTLQLSAVAVLTIFGRELLPIFGRELLNVCVKFQAAARGRRARVA